MKETQEEIILSDHIYESDKTYMIPVKGNQLLHWIDVLGLIVEKETVNGMLLQCPVNSEFVMQTKEDGESVEAGTSTTYIEFPTPESFVNQQPTSMLSRPGILAWDVLMSLQAIHLENIKNNVTIKREKQ